jgi:hypothetical protein
VATSIINAQLDSNKDLDANKKGKNAKPMKKGKRDCVDRVDITRRYKKGRAT